MTDVLTPKQRSYCMSRIKGKDTKPELIVRKILTDNGYRYRLHRKDITGKPDIAFIGLKKLIFVHGCFWHRHQGCKYAYVPKTDPQKWQKKFRSNIERDQTVLKELAEDGWSVLVIWECETKHHDQLTEKIALFMQAVGTA